MSWRYKEGRPVHLRQRTETPEESLLRDLLRQKLVYLYGRELGRNALIDYRHAARSGTPATEDDFPLLQLLHADEFVVHPGRRNKRSIQMEFDLALAERLVEQHLLEDDLSQAISEGALSLVFEPIVSPAGDCCMVEALLRWMHPKRGSVPATVFIPLAERTGEIVNLGRWALREACQEALTWQGNPPPVVSVNVSPTQIVAGSFVYDVFAALNESGLSPSRLQIELTENVLASNLKSFNSALGDLQRSGIQIALDDFGTGFSSLSYLRTLRIDRIKIDRSFIQASDADSVSILQAIVNMAQALRLETIAEGIETTSQADLAISLGAHYLQGFLFTGVSLTADEMRIWLANHYPGGVPLKSTHSLVE